MPDQRDEFAFASYFQTQDAKADVGIMKVTRSTSPSRRSSSALDVAFSETVDMDKAQTLSQR
jgi:hypothetical protein